MQGLAVKRLFWWSALCGLLGDLIPVLPRFAEPNSFLLEGALDMDLSVPIMRGSWCYQPLDGSELWSIPEMVGPGTYVLTIYEFTSLGELSHTKLFPGSALPASLEPALYLFSPSFFS